MLEFPGYGPIVQSMSIVRFLARRYSLYGDSDDDRVMCDMIADSIQDFSGGIIDLPFVRRAGVLYGRVFVGSFTLILLSGSSSFIR